MAWTVFYYWINPFIILIHHRFDRYELFHYRMAATLDNWIVWSINKCRYRTDFTRTMDFTRTNTVTEMTLFAD